MTERARGPSDVHPAEGYGWVSMCLLRGHATSAPLSCSREKVPEVEEKEVALHHGATHLFRRRLRVEGCLVLSESRSLQRWEGRDEHSARKLWHGISISCLFPASWHFSLSPVVLPRFLLPSFRQLLLLGLLAGVMGLLYLLLVTGKGQYSWLREDRHIHTRLGRVPDMEATDTENPNLNYGLVVDCGSSGSRVFVYTWPRHNGNPHELLDIKQMRDKQRKPVVMKIKPGISEYASTPEQASDYISPLLSFAAQHIPKPKHQETPLYILCTAGMRVLPESQQEALLEDLRTDIPVNFNFLFSDSHVEVISGKQEVVNKYSATRSRRSANNKLVVPSPSGIPPLRRRAVVSRSALGELQASVSSWVKPLSRYFRFRKGSVIVAVGVYAWIGINFVLGRFNHVEDEQEALVEVQVPGSDQQETLLRKRTAGVLDMGGVSTQIAYEVPKTVSFASPQQEDIAKNLLAEFNLGCDAHRTEHVYRVYVSTFLGFGGNAARHRYEEHLLSSIRIKNKLLGQHQGESADSPLFDPCLPSELRDELGPPDQRLFLRGSGDFERCRVLLQPFLNHTNQTGTSLNGVYQPLIDFPNSHFYGFSEFYYCTEDVLRMGGHYNASKYTNAAKNYCGTPWKTLKERFDRGLYASHADQHRLKTALLVYEKEVQWTLGAILYRTRFLPLRYSTSLSSPKLLLNRIRRRVTRTSGAPWRFGDDNPDPMAVLDIQQESLKPSHSHWHHSFSFLNNHFLFLVCFLVVFLSILLYLLRLRRIHNRATLAARSSANSVQWLEEGLASPVLPVTL
ncbi:hypothetical protein DNTS_011094 [Danionella cerebrum]|uniref:nucleoside-triphosphate phosphatase n=1 Tax=Danionella cerebrum TaxID=2873325 RepID=A0A553RP08_9TELE|nr:hypothetical protein DNTS_011094 [Danionella translucida]TRZ03911.1 hypothetical protein DNTS_011094 [Danionella translucida]